MWLREACSFNSEVANSSSNVRSYHDTVAASNYNRYTQVKDLKKDGAQILILAIISLELLPRKVFEAILTLSNLSFEDKMIYLERYNLLIYKKFNRTDESLDATDRIYALFLYFVVANNISNGELNYESILDYISSLCDTNYRNDVEKIEVFIKNGELEVIKEF